MVYAEERDSVPARVLALGIASSSSVHGVNNGCSGAYICPAPLFSEDQLPAMRPNYNYTCNRCLSLVRNPSLRRPAPSPALRIRASQKLTQRHHSAKSQTHSQLSLPRRSISTTLSTRFERAFEPREYVDPEGITRKLVLDQNNLFHSFTHSPIPDIRKRAAFMRQHAYCPHPSHKPTRVAHNSADLESRKDSVSGTPPAHVDFECPDCGVPVYCCEEHWADDYEAHLEVCDVMKQANEDDHDLHSGRFFGEFQFAEPQIEEILTNMSSWDTYLYTRDFDALNEDQEMRQATKLLTYPMTIASVIHELSPYNIRKKGRMTPEGLKSFSGMYIYQWPYSHVSLTFGQPYDTPSIHPAPAAATRGRTPALPLLQSVSSSSVRAQNLPFRERPGCKWSTFSTGFASLCISSDLRVWPTAGTNFLYLNAHR